jgi:hypothetical protein
MSQEISVGRDEDLNRIRRMMGRDKAHKRSFVREKKNNKLKSSQKPHVLETIFATEKFSPVHAKCNAYEQFFLHIPVATTAFSHRAFPFSRFSLRLFFFGKKTIEFFAVLVFSSWLKLLWKIFNFPP